MTGVPDAMVDFIRQMLEGLGAEATVVIMSMLPVVELRGAIPVGMALGLTTFHSTILSFIGSMIPVPLILFGIRPIFDLLRKTRLFRGLVDRLIKKSLNKGARIQKAGILALFIFVAIPLPGTGVWSGSLIASLLDMRFKYAFPVILVGNLIAGLIIMSLSSGAFAILAS